MRTDYGIESIWESLVALNIQYKIVHKDGI